MCRGHGIEYPKYAPDWQKSEWFNNAFWGSIFFIALSIFGVWSGDWLHPKWTIICGGALVYVLTPLLKINFPLGLAAGYTIAAGLFYSLSEFSPLTVFVPGVANSLAYDSMIGAMFVLCLVILLQDFKRWAWLIGALWMVCIITSIYSVIGYYFDLYIVGLSFNKSLSATLAAMLFPFVLYRFDKWSIPAALAWIIPIASVVYVKSSIGFFAVVAALMAYFVASQERKIVASIMAIGTAALGAAAALLWYGEKLWGFSGRLEMWRDTWIYFHRSDWQVFGFGVGSFYKYGNEIMRVNGLNADYGTKIFVTLHNDILQCLFELGWVGLSLWVLAFGYSAYKSLDRPWAAAFFAALAVSSFGNFPHHMGLEAFLIAFMYRGSTEKLGG